MTGERKVPTITVEYPYNRTLGPVVGRFFTGLRDGEIWANRTKTGTVMCPPYEYDPNTGEAAQDEWVRLDGTGTVTTWSWIADPLRNHLLQRPFAWALIRLDGADTAMLHAVDAPRESMRTGMRVRVRFRDERQGHISDIECFEAV
jgi:uncharacterized protein